VIDPLQQHCWLACLRVGTKVFFSTITQSKAFPQAGSGNQSCVAKSLCAAP
jgi:hypothetical protein